MINKENYLQNIPPELRQYQQWLWFKKIIKVDKWGKEKISKIPISPITLKSDGWNDKKHWTDCNRHISFKAPLISSISS